MRVGLVIDDLDRRRGGMSEWSWQFVSAAARRGYELHIVAQGFGVEPLPPRVSRHAIPRSGSRLAFAKQADETLRDLKLDVIHDMGMGWNFDYFQSHGGSYDGWLRRRLDMYPRWFRAIKRPIDALLPRHRNFEAHWRRQSTYVKDAGKTVVALSQMVADDFNILNQIPAKRIEVIYNGVDCQRYSPANRARYRTHVRQTLGIREESLLLLVAAHNFRLKGVPEFLQAAGRLVAAGRDITAIIAGGKRLDAWRSRAATLGLEGRVNFLGFIPELVPFYAAADVFVHPTYYDPCSLVLLEAAASGLPIITTRRYNGAAELFRPGRDLLTIPEPTNIDALCECVDSMFDARLRNQLGLAARNVALQHTFDRNVTEILRLYNRDGARRAAA
jgi:UDP-glucose:(heptosyl)LPS alpha-1,3-glucosyltransferase